MNRKNFKAVASFEDSTGLKCVDLIQTEENFFTFKTFRKDPEDPNEELIKCPALENMNPVNQISDKGLHIKIREFVPIKWAWWGHDYASLVTSGKMHWNFQEGQKPYFESDEDIIYSESLTDDVSREYFHTMINILTREFEKYQTYT